MLSLLDIVEDTFGRSTKGPKPVNLPGSEQLDAAFVMAKLTTIQVYNP